MIGRLLVGVGLLVGAMNAWAGPAGSQTADVDRQGYALSGPSVPGLHEEGRLYVAIVGGQEQARSFVHVDLAPGSPVRALILAMLEGTDGQGAARPDAATILACPRTDRFRAGAQPPDDAPADDCTVSVPGSRDATGRWTFDLTPLARRWAEGEPNHGLVLRPVAAPAATWRVVFDPELSSAQVERRGVTPPGRSTPAAIPSVRPAEEATPTPPALPGPSQVTAGSPSAAPPSITEGPATGTVPAARPELVPSARSSESAGGRAPPWPLVTLVLVPGLAAAAAWWLPLPRALPRWRLSGPTREGGSGG